MDPMMLLNTQFASGLGNALGGSLGGSKPAGPSNAVAGAYGASGLDASGWAVNFQGVQNANSAADKSGADGLLSSTGGMSNTLIYGLVIFGVVMVWRRKSKSAK